MEKNKMVQKDAAVLFVHGKGGNAGEAEHYKDLFTDCDVYGIDYHGNTPWETKPEIQKEIEQLKLKYKRVILIANSIGAFFTMNAGIADSIEKAYFISPIVNMEKLIGDMMLWAGVTPNELQDRKTIETDFGENLSWEYLTYVKEHPIKWEVPTSILYGRNDNLTSYDTIMKFADDHHAKLTVMTGGEHWFHTEEQMRFLDEWIKNNADANVKI